MLTLGVSWAIFNIKDDEFLKHHSGAMVWRECLPLWKVGESCFGETVEGDLYAG